MPVVDYAFVIEKCRVVLPLSPYVRAYDRLNKWKYLNETGHKYSLAYIIEIEGHWLKVKVIIIRSSNDDPKML